MRYGDLYPCRSHLRAYALWAAGEPGAARAGDHRRCYQRIEQVLPNEQQVSSMPLAPFTEREARTYQARCGVTAEDRVATI